MSVRGVVAGLEQAVVARPSVAGVWVGVEHEFRVLRAGEPVDFRRLVGGLGAGSGRGGLDPGDPRARRLGSGALLTADGREAEVATPPVVVGRGFTDEVVGRASDATGRLGSVLPTGLGLEGFSTHVSVSVPDGRVVRTARRFVDSHALALMLLMDRVESPGLLVRPRRGRLEFCGEFVSGDHLRVAVLFAVASTSGLLERRVPRGARVPVVVEPARERFGFYVGRRAFGPDLYEHGRAAVLPDGRTAQEALGACWAWTRPTALAIAAEAEVALVDDVVAGRRPLPLEATGVGRFDEGRPVGLVPDPFGSVLRPRHRGEVTVSPRVVTWPAVVLDVTRGDVSCHVLVPGRSLDGFLTALDGGHLDTALGRVVDAAGRLPVLRASTTTDRIGAFRRVDDPGHVVPDERDPVTGRPSGPNGPGSRRNKHRSHTPPLPVPEVARSRKPLLIAVAAFVALLLLGAAAIAATSGGDDDRATTPTSTVVPTTSASPPGGPTGTRDGGEPDGESTAAELDACRLFNSADARALYDANAESGGLSNFTSGTVTTGSSEGHSERGPGGGEICTWEVETFDEVGYQAYVSDLAQVGGGAPEPRGTFGTGTHFLSLGVAHSAGSNCIVTHRGWCLFLVIKAADREVVVPDAIAAAVEERIDRDLDYSVASEPTTSPPTSAPPTTEPPSTEPPTTAPP